VKGNVNWVVVGEIDLFLLWVMEAGECGLAFKKGGNEPAEIKGNIQ
jgi:hypothetical protein